MAEKTATFALKVDSDTKPTEEQKKALEELRVSIAKSQDLLKQHGAALRSLRGNSDEVTDARAKLKAAIEAERASISRNNLAILKMGSSYEKLAKEARTAAAANKEMGKAVSAVGGPVSDASEKFGKLRDVLALCKDPMVAIAVAAAAAIAVIAVLSAAIVAAAISLGRFVVESANVLRAQGLMREAVTGSAEDAGRMGRQVDFLATQLATPKERLNELYVAMRRTFDGARISGQGILDAFTAVATTSEAMGDSAGAALQGILDRSKRFGRGGINLFELQGTGGPNFDEIASALAKSTRVGVAQARQELLTFRVPIDQLAAAMKDAAQVKFGDVNAKKLLDLDVIAAKFRENLVGLSKTFSESAGFQVFLADLKQLADLFSVTTSTGASLQTALGAFGTLIGATFHASMPYVIWAIKEAIILSLRFAIALLDAATAIVNFAHSRAGLILMKSALAGIAVAIAIVALAFVPIAAAAAVIGLAFLAVGAAVYGIYEAVGWLRKQDWPAIGGAIVNGIKSGLLAAWNGLEGAVHGIATGIMNAFTGKLRIESPSKVFAHYGRMTTQGFAEGVTSTSGDATDAVQTMVGPTSPDVTVSASAGGAGGGPSMVVNVNIYGGGDAQAVADTVRSSGVLGAITHAIEIAARGLGVPTQQAAGA
jgi:hypothetical protein